MKKSTRADETGPSAAVTPGSICPRCRTQREADPEGSDKVHRCPDDGAAFVSFDAFAESDGDPFLGATIADRFVLLAKIGAGSMGTVYRARQEAMARDVAVKVLRSDRALDSQSKARFVREARAMSLLTSPHTVTVFDFGEIAEGATADADGSSSLYLAMELLEGESLGARLKRKRRLSIPDAVRVAKHALLSLAEAHEKGVIHRDLKPDNLFLVEPQATTHEPLCKLLDFGIAKVLRETGDVDALETQAGTVFGTPRYMSPEQAQGKTLDARSDLYSVGVLLYQMLVGRAPFSDDDAVVVMARHIKSAPVPPIEAAPEANLPRGLSDLVVRALAKDPAGRPPDAMSFIEALDRAVVLGELEVHGPADGSTGEMAALTRDDLSEPEAAPPRSKERKPSRVAIAIGAALSGALVAAGLLATTSGPAAKPPNVARSGFEKPVSAALIAVMRGAAAAEPSDAAAPEPAPVEEPTKTAAPLAPRKAAPKASAPKKGYTRFE